MPYILKDPLTWWTILCFAIGFGLGRALDAIIYLLTGRKPTAWLLRDVTYDRELFTTTTPDRYPPGRVVTLLEGQRVVTDVVDLGSFTDLQGDQHQQWRVMGRPA